MACTPDSLEKLSDLAKNEIGENGVDIEAAVQNVGRLVLEKYPQLRLPPDADQLFEWCLRVRKFDIDRAVVQVHDYFKFVEYLYEIHGNMEYFLPSIHRHYFFDSGAVEILKHRDSQGRILVVVRFDRLPPETFSLDATLAVSYLILEALHHSSVDTQRLGMVIVADFGGFSWGHLKRFTPARIRACVKLLRGGLPVRYKGIHVVRASTLFVQFHAIFKPLFGPKLSSRIHVHSSDLTQFHDSVSPAILPERLGGTLSGSEHVDMPFVNRLITRDAYYKELLKYGYMGSLNGEREKINQM